MPNCSSRKPEFAPEAASTENSVKHLSLNWAPDDNPTREHMIETTKDFLRHMKWQEHQAILVAHDDKHMPMFI